MIPITLSIFGAKAGDAAVARAGAGDRLRRRHRRHVRRARARSSGCSGKAFGTFLGNPWVVVPLALFFVAMGLSMFGAFEVALPAGLQERLSRVGGRGLRRRVPDGPGRRHHRRALHGAAAGRRCWPTSRPRATRAGASSLLATYGAGVGAAVLAAGRRSRCRCRARAPGWSGSRASSASRSSRRRSTTSRTSCRRWPTSRRPRPRFALTMAALIAGRRRARRHPRQLPRRRARARAQGLRRRPGDGRAVRRDQLRADAQGRRSSSPG